MMTEADKDAWNSFTDEGAHYIVDEVTRAAGETLLRGALRRVLVEDLSGEPRRDALIYQILMAATDAGYQCGIHVDNPIRGAVQITAYVTLPNGVIGMPLTPDFGFTYIAYGEFARETVRGFLGD